MQIRERIPIPKGAKRCHSNSEMTRLRPFSKPETRKARRPKGAESTDSATSRGSALKWDRLLYSLFVPLLMSAASLFGLARPAAAEVVDSVGAHLGFLSEKPKSLPLDLPVLPTGSR